MCLYIYSIKNVPKYNPPCAVLILKLYVQGVVPI